MISKEPENRKDFKKSFYFTKSGRVGFSHILKCLFSNSKDKILMPAYIGETDKEGSGVFDPIRDNKVLYEFYSMNRDLSINMEDLRPKVISNKYKSLLVIHYFGFVQNNMEELCSLCKENGVILIEDCAHSFSSSYKGRNIGEWGDLSFFSIHKIIATKDGGYFRINNNDSGVTELSYENQNILPDTIEQFIRSDYEKINIIRRLNYQKYLYGLVDIKGVYPLYPELPDGIVPLNFPIIVENGLREKLYFKLIEKKVITCALYYRLIKEIKKNLYPISYDVSTRILNLPTHQDTSFSDIDEIVIKLKESIKDLKYSV
jgi:dTDP-4-amino-4,6-dideoxygalactose transaminase